jgi:hypothetical protein
MVLPQTAASIRYLHGPTMAMPDIKLITGTRGNGNEISPIDAIISDEFHYSCRTLTKACKKNIVIIIYL